MITEAYCSFEVAKLLKEKGFNCPCRVLYSYIGEFNNDVCNRDVDWNSISPNGDISAPTQQMAMAWLREKGFCIEPYAAAYRYGFTISKVPTGSFICNEFDCYLEEECETYEEAVEAALKYSLEKLI